MEQQTGSKLGEEFVKAVYCHRLFNLYVEYIMRHAGLDDAQARIKITGEISITSDMQKTTPQCRKRRGSKKPLDESERGE